MRKERPQVSPFSSGRKGMILGSFLFLPERMKVPWTFILSDED
jgi:hypothetical protein